MQIKLYFPATLLCALQSNYNIAHIPIDERGMGIIFAATPTKNTPPTLQNRVVATSNDITMRTLTHFRPTHVFYGVMDSLKYARHIPRTLLRNRHLQLHIAATTNSNCPSTKIKSQSIQYSKQNKHRTNSILQPTANSTAQRITQASKQQSNNTQAAA